MCKFITKVTVPRTLWELKPLQSYIRQLAEICGVAQDKLLHVEMLVEELGVNIARYALIDDPDGKIEITVLKDLSAFILSFHYRGVPYGLDIDHPKDEVGQISMELIHGLSSSFCMRENGKAGQTLEVKIALPEDSLTPELDRPRLLESHKEKGLATDPTTIRHIMDSDMQLLVQCLYSVFGYNYSADYMYNAEALIKRRADKLYEGIVAVNSKNEIVGHVGLLKNSPDDKICECGQAFVMPQYGKRKLFTTLKQELIHYADQIGLLGVFSSAVTGHPFTQRGNLALGCVETGLELGYIPADVESMIKRRGEGKRQPVMNFFKSTSHSIHQKLWLPACHYDIVTETYRQLSIERDFALSPKEEIEDGLSVIDFEINTIWNQAHLYIKKAGKQDFIRRIEAILRRSGAAGCAVCYVSLPLNTPDTVPVVNMLQDKCGFFYAGIMPYEDNGTDTIRLQCLLQPDAITRDDVIAESEWGQKLRDYIFKNKDEKIIL